MLLGKVLLLLISYRIAICQPCNYSWCDCCQRESCNYNGICTYGCKNGHWGDRCHNSCPKNCITCTDNLHCGRCVDGFYNGFDHTSMNRRYDCSLKCSTRCKKCVESYCYECNEGYYLASGQCSKCVKSCKSCTTQTYCLTCNDGYYLDRSSCKVCDYSCKTCSSPTECKSCSNGFYLSDKYCLQCRSHCISCSWNDNCNRCLDEYYLENESCHKCSDRFGQCYMCSSQCLSCAFSNYCSTCKEGYFAHKGVCQQCSLGCNSCTWYSNCNGCKAGYYLQGSYCNKCLANCITCSSHSDCTKCQSGYYLEHIISYQYSYQYDSCVRCPINCDSCISQHNCNECKAGFKGPVCSDNCSNCKTGSACDQITGHCGDGCTEGYTSASCDRKCYSVCKSCSQQYANKCFGCVENRYGKIFDYYTCGNICPERCLNQACDDDTGNCLYGCQDGYWGPTCSATCSDNCIESKCYSENGFCSRGCIKGFEGERCSCPQNCNCFEDGVCKTCKHGFAVIQRNCKCTACLDSSCTSCFNSTYYVMGNHCCPCSHNCKNNECISDSECLSGCKIGYYRNDCSKLCTNNDINCLECLSDDNNDYGGCSRCFTNYYPSQENRVCRLCSRKCKNGTCDSRHGNCSTGCEDGWWGHTCENRCSPGCVICAQSDGICSVCADDKYLYDCSLTCSETCNTTNVMPRCRVIDGTCVFGCVNRTFYGTKCETKCSSTCQEQTCNQINGACLNGCTGNYFGPQCEYKCKDTCLHSKDGKLCYEANGTCLSNCQNGYHGYMCNMTCSQTCANRTCNRLTGACEYGCNSGFEGSRCEMALEHTSDVSHSNLKIGASVGATFLVVLIVGAIVGLLLIKRRHSKRKQEDEAITDTTVVTYSEVVLSGNQEEQNDAVYAVPNKPKKNAAERSKTSDSDTESKNADYQLNNTKHHNVNSVNIPNYTNDSEYGENMSKDKSTKGDNDNIINRTRNNKRPLAQNPRVFYENTNVQESVYRNSEAQKNSNRSAYSFLEIDEEDVSGLAANVQENTTTRGDEFDYAYYNVAAMKKRKVMLDELSAYVSKKTKDDFIDEFNELPAGLIKAYTESQKKENIRKNRYKGIYPYDQRRVVLREGDSDYINASYIDGYKKIKAYIASIGPTYKYMEDMSPFWRMVWQEKVGKIVMLTKLSEAGEPKCDQYWPDKDCSEVCLDIRVTTDREEIYADYTVRSFTLQKNSEVRSIVHAHFTAWPDKGIPDDVTSLIEFRQKVNSLCTDLDGPIVVHCSAGIGRTGTYISIDSLAQEGEAEGRVDIYACVINLREHRVNMVQTAGQYQYLHNALVHTLTFGCKPIKASKFHEYMSTHTTEQLGNQFLHLQASIKIRSDDETEAVRMNKRMTDKNRSDADIPGDICRPRLHLRRKQGMSGYINALYINSFRTKNRFLVAQTPLKNTVEDFLTLIVQENVSCIVTLEPSLNGNKTVGTYYPDDSQPLKVGSCTVQSEKADCTDQYIQRKLNIVYQGKSSTKEVTVTHIQFTKWIEKQKPPDDPKMFMRFVKDVELKCDGDDKERPVLVHCLTGAEKSGLFCVVSILLEKIQLEQEISVVNTVRQVKNRRHKSIPNKEQYIFCHQCLDEYLHTFDTYSNFCLER
ncbi:cell death abnormality protein 1-like [Mercenaria mercenaria]|uniref:cell death abnormality protein 1-like n=1 Tax=Mercenaria mercenaria TaxID=6596 RepID=UPI00234ED741|nr:cell death abnormality protein 1-like [Mercenaria mercenaria]